MELNFKPALTEPSLIAIPVKECLETWGGTIPVEEILVAEIDPQFMGGTDLFEHYKIPQAVGANCVIIEIIKGSSRSLGACLIPTNCTRTDFNGVVRKYFNARRISLAPLAEVLKETRMEYGSITVVGLPKSWPILIDPSIVAEENVIIGSGLQKSKLSVPGKALLELPGASVLEGICAIK